MFGKFVGNKDIYDENVFIAFLYKNYLGVPSSMAVHVWLVYKIVPHFGLLVAVALFIKWEAILLTMHGAKGSRKKVFFFVCK